MNYLAKLFKTGAIRQTPKRIVARIAGEVSLAAPHTTIVEIGAGLGEITKPIVRKAKDKKQLAYYAFEIDQRSCRYLQEQLPQVRVLRESAFEFEAHIPSTAKLDYFISSIPLSFNKKKTIEDFLGKIKTRLAPGGKLIIVFSALWLIPLFKKHLPGLQLSSYLTFPPYFLVVYSHH